MSHDETMGPLGRMVVPGAQARDVAEGVTDLERPTVPPDGAPAEAQPKWREDFPIDLAQDEYVSRRDLVKFLCLTSAGFVAGQGWVGVQSLIRRGRAQPAPLAIARVDDLPIGGAKVFEFPEGSAPRLLVRIGERSFVAYEQQCTHLQCPVVPAVRPAAAADRGGLQLHCPCHEGWFDLITGAPIAGPPQRALTRIELEVRGDAVYATGLRGPLT